MADRAKEMKAAGKDKYPYPSQCGSHKSMINNDLTAKLGREDLAVCQDLFGLYITETKNLDNGMADPWRNVSTEWRENYFKDHGL